MAGRAATQVRAPQMANYLFTEGVNEQSAMHLHIRTFALKCHLCESNPQPQLLRPRTLRNLQQASKLSLRFGIFSAPPISPIFCEVGEIGASLLEFPPISPISLKNRRGRRESVGILTDIAGLAGKSAKSVGILADHADLAGKSARSASTCDL